MKYVACLLVLVLIVEAVDSSCRVADFSVQQDFDIKRYVGVMWYEQKLLPISFIPDDELYKDYQQTYYLRPDGKTITTYVRGRDPVNSLRCSYFTVETKTTDTPGKWLNNRGNDTHPVYADRWIISTDYTTYSVVYKCEEQNATGECISPNAWVFSQTPQLPIDKEDIVENTLDTLCVNKSAFVVTQQTNECPVDKGCAIYSIESKRMQNFDVQKFVGKWYATSWLPQTYHAPNEFYQDYQHYYTLNSDETILTAFSRGRDPVDLEKCFYNQAQLFPTAEDGKFIYRRNINSTYFLSGDYWVMSTDYVKYAVVYGCRNLDSTGHCTYADSWIWSRSPTIPDDVKASVDSKIQDLCVNTSMYLPTEQNNECTDVRDCSVASIALRMVQNFTGKFKGRWYRYSYHSTTPQATFTDYQVILTGINSEDDTVVSHSRSRNPRRGGECEYNETVLHLTDTPGKTKSTVKTTKGDVELTTYSMATDYTSYRVSYSCFSQDENFKCNNSRASLWSRSPTLSLEKLTKAQLTIVGLCLNYDDFVKVEQSHYCPALVSSKGFQTTGAFILTTVAIWAVIHLKDPA